MPQRRSVFGELHLEGCGIQHRPYAREKLACKKGTHLSNRVAGQKNLYDIDQLARRRRMSTRRKCGAYSAAASSLCLSVSIGLPVEAATDSDALATLRSRAMGAVLGAAASALESA